MTCAHCADTGSLSKTIYGFLDCAHCDVAEERARVEAWARRATPEVQAHSVWLIYQQGKASAKPA
ncbi:hypothetical protein [Massilia sp. ZL223]|uniref:hypothetical protein n=1 Tax=Massilia sp. ZL223 TaxID=2824904 RepID=UPI001B83E791|nr:hypothetical protein [Massilia sp. ZL223]MBQ5963178.1 hypothetical protein [Massilia sp. ZL223]